MLLSYLWMIGFCIGMLLTIPVLCISYLVKLIFTRQISERFTYLFTKFWAKSIILTTGSNVKVINFDNISDEKNICFICNHQSFFDIPVLMGWLGRPVGFIAKKELQKIPVLSGWIKIIHSAFIDRSSSRKAIDSINQAAEEIKQGHAIVIFPEGTRSRNGQIEEFKTGSLKLAFNSDAIIQPLTLVGTREIYEENKQIRKQKVVLYIHKPIYPADEIYHDKQLLISMIYNQISQKFDMLRLQETSPNNNE